MSFQLTEEQMTALETPCLVVDVEVAQRNILTMQAQVDALRVALRPHIKTHKMPYFALKQLAAGAAGISCAKVSEAEIMAAAGIDDIFIAYPLVGDFRIKRVLSLKEKVKRLILAVDSLEGAKTLNEAAERAKTVLEVRIEIDTGVKRTGIPISQAVELATQVTTMNNLQLSGIYTFKSLVYQGTATMDNELAGQEEGALMAEVAEAIRAAGIPLNDISAGSSPTGLAVGRTGKVTEIRPGTYIFADVMLCKEKVADPEDIAVRYYASVVSTPSPELAVIDGGTKTFPTDVAIKTAPAYYPGYAVVVGNDDLVLDRMYEEHGVLTSLSGDTGLKVGDKIALLPIHVCTAVNLHNSVYLLEDGQLRIQKVDARGMLV